MLNEILQIIQGVTLALIPILAILFLIYSLKDLTKRKYFYKSFTIYQIVMIFTISILLIIMLQTHQLSLVWIEYEKTNHLEPYVKTTGYIMINTFYLIVYGCVLFILKYINEHQIIPGSGSVKNRLKSYFKKFKEEIKIKRRKEK